MDSFEIKKHNLDYTIYCNIESFMRVRGKTIIGNGFDGKESAYPLSEVEFNKKIKSSKHIPIYAKSGDESLTIIFLNSSSDLYKKDKLAALLTKTIGQTIIVKPAKNKIKINTLNNDKVIQIVDGDVYLIKDWAAINDEKGRSWKIISAKEWESSILCDDFHVTIDELPAISVLACEIVWSGAKHGDAIELISPSLSSNGYTSSIYRVVNK